LMAAAVLAVAVLGAYEAPGLLAHLLSLKRREVEQLRKRPEAQQDGAWMLKLGYPASEASYELSRAIGWRRESLAIIADIKRTTPGSKLGDVHAVAQNLNIETAVDRALELGVQAALVNTDRTSYGGALADLSAACSCAKEAEATGGSRLPIVAKDLIIDPLQIARAAVEGANAVLLIVSTAADVLPGLLDTCTLLGMEALVEVHTADEVRLAAECGASLFLVNERDRSNGVLVTGQAASLAGVLPQDATCIAGGGISTIEQVRTLREAGYDGVVLGRSWPGTGGTQLVREVREQPTEGEQRLAEVIRVPMSPPSAPAGGG